MPPDLGRIEAYHYVSLYILIELLGDEWAMRYLAIHDQPFLKTRSKDFRDIDRFFLRVMSLAEMLLNLQDVPGFPACIERLAGGDIESAFAELEVGKLLSMFGVRFRFNEPSLVAKADYDLIVFFQNGEQGFAETKCKAEMGRLTEQSVRNSLGQARSQLPNDGPGVIFMKIPEEWITKKEFSETTNRAIRRFLGTTRKIVAVELFAAGFKITLDGIAEPLIAGAEIINQRHRFDPSRDWSLIGPIPRGTPLVPPSWWRSISALIDPPLTRADSGHRLSE
jgi:hypothetical protein